MYAEKSSSISVIGSAAERPGLYSKPKLLSAMLYARTVIGSERTRAGADRIAWREATEPLHSAIVNSQARSPKLTRRTRSAEYG